jgi:trans-2,3-dihydro-3-hydroxyanthranilate isomerase
MMEENEVIPWFKDWRGESELHRYVVCDVFTSVPLQGNQLAVFLDGRSLATTDMQRLAREFNFTETVFLFPSGAGGDVAIRIFTPRSELPFAGAPVLGTAFVVANALGVDSVTLETRSGLIPVNLERDGALVVFGWMQQPIPTWRSFERQGELLDALGVVESALPIELYDNGVKHVYVTLANEDAVAALTPDAAALATLEVAANCIAGAERSWQTRTFYPAAGVVEDAATGSAAGLLAVHLARHGRIRFGEEIEIRQGAQLGRPSQLYASATGEGDRIDYVEVGGSAVIVAEGRYRVR